MNGNGAPDAPLYPTPSQAFARPRRDLTPEIDAAFISLSQKVFADGPFPTKVKQLIAVVVAHVTQCSRLHQGPRALGVPAWRPPDEIMEAIREMAEMRAGAAYAHSVLALDMIGRGASKP